MRVFLMITALLLSMGTAAQNLVDEEGNKTGSWKVDYPNGNTLYTAFFVEGRPVGELVRYYETGEVRARMRFDSVENSSYTRLFYTSGKLAAEGWHREQVKDSVWTYYSEFDGSVRIREPYRMGALNGWVRKYYEDGTVSEEVQWENNKKEGPWKRYYKNGALRLKSNYENDLLQGPYEVFFADSTLQVQGHYVNEQSQGSWHYYNVNGEEMYVIEYDHGKVLNREKYLEMMSDTLNKYNEILEAEEGME